MVVAWEFGGKMEICGSESHYRYAIAVYEDGREERFQIGNCVCMQGPFKGRRVGMIVDFFNDSTERRVSCRRVVLRWFYSNHHLNKNTVIEKDVPPHYGSDELYFADDIDYGDYSLKAIAGKVFVYQDVEDFLEQTKRRDGCYLVRSFYRPTPFRKPSLRKLQPGELDFLLRNPGPKEMYDRYAKAHRARRLYVPKKKQFDVGKITKVPRSKKYHAGARQLRRMAERDYNDVHHGRPPPKKKEKKPGILDIMFSKSQRFRYA